MNCLFNFRIRTVIAVGILLALYGLLTASPARAETEPNDVREQADLIKIGWNQADTARLSPAGDVDYFKFAAKAGRTYVIETFDIQGNSDNATGLYLYDDAGQELANDLSGEYGTGAANARMVYTVNRDGVYFFRVLKDYYQNSWSGTYSVRVLAKYNEPGAGWNSQDDSEPNDSRMLAYEIEVGWDKAQTHRLDPYPNIVSQSTDQDYYRFAAKAGRTYVIETFDIQGNSDNATGLYLYDDAGQELANDRSGEYGTGAANARMVYTVNRDGVYFFRVLKDYYQNSWSGTYSVRVLAKYNEPGAGWNSQDDSEPNDSRMLAYAIGVGWDKAQTHRLDPYPNIVSQSTDQDYYRFAAKAGRTYVIETFDIQGNSNNATGLYLYDDTGQELANDRSGEYGTGAANARIVHTLLRDGVYFFRVLKDYYQNSWSGTYSVRVCVDDCSIRVCRNNCNIHIYLPQVKR